MPRQCGCGSVHEETELGFYYNLYDKIDKDRVQCLNEYVEGTGVTVFKTWNERLNKSEFVESDMDAELLFNIPFIGNVKLKGLIVIGDEVYEPQIVRLYKNRPNMLFDDVISPDQEFELHHDRSGLHEYPVKTVKFSSVHHLSLHFGSEGDHLKIYYIGLRGEWTPARNHGVTICTYETRSLLNTHSHELDGLTIRHIK